MEFVGRDYVIVSKRLAHKREIVACAEALKLSRREVVALVLEFWAWCDDNTSDGLLKGICTQAALDGLVGTIGFTEAMVQVGWLRLTSEGYALPNWGRWNGDTAKSRLLNRERVARHRDRGGGKKCNANVMPEALQGDNGEGVYSLNTPVSNSVIPDPEKALREEILEVFAHYRTFHPKAHLKPHSRMKEWTRIRARLREGCSVDDLKLAIEGCHKSRWHQGDNDRNQRYDSLELIVRDSSKVNQFIELAAKGEGPVLSEKTRRTLSARESYLAKRSATDGSDP